MQVQGTNSNHQQSFGMKLIPMGELKGKNLTKLKELIGEIKPLDQNICVDSFSINGSGISKTEHSYGFTLATGTEEANKVFINSNKEMTIDNILEETNDRNQTAFDVIVDVSKKLGKRMELEIKMAEDDKTKLLSQLEGHISEANRVIERIRNHK